MKGFFITGIGTDVGKTVVSAIVTEALKADYWKPIQAGDLNNTDTMNVQKYIANSGSVFYPETYRLNTPASPHLAAEIDKVTIDLQSMSLPETDNTLVVEGAGGLMVPINDTELIVDMIDQFQLPVILVSRHYLGSINHTLLSIEALKQRHIRIAAIIYNGPESKATEEIIYKRTGIEVIGRVEQEDTVDKAMVSKYAALFKDKLEALI